MLDTMIGLRGRAQPFPYKIAMCQSSRNGYAEIVKRVFIKVYLAGLQNVSICLETHAAPLGLIRL